MSVNHYCQAVFCSYRKRATTWRKMQARDACEAACEAAEDDPDEIPFLAEGPLSGPPGPAERPAAEGGGS